MIQRECPECGAALLNVAECRDYLNEMVKWDFEDFTGVGRIHHVTVLSYNLQHPSVYSPKGLEYAKKSLVEFIKNPMDYTAHGMRDRESLGFEVRDWKITGTPENHGEYVTKPEWKMVASDVVQGGLAAYVENVKKWSASVIESLAKSGNLN